MSAIASSRTSEADLCKAECKAAELTIRILRTWEELSSVQPHWNELLTSSENGPIALTWEWLSSHRAAYGDRELFVLVCYGGQGELVGIAPFYKSHWPKPAKLAMKVLRFIGDETGDCGNLGIIVRRGCEAPVANAFLGSLEGNHEWDAIGLNQLSSDSSGLEAVLRERNWTFSRRETPHLILKLSAGWESLLSSLSKNHREVLSARLRNIDLREMQFRRCETVGQAFEAIKQLVRLHTARWQEQGVEGAFADPKRSEFYKELARSLMRRNMLDCWVMEMNGKIVAVEFGCIHESTRLAMQSGFDPEYRKSGIGAVLEARVIQAAIEAGLKSYDFLGGDHWFKKRWGAEQSPYVSIRCSKGRVLGRLWVRAGEHKIATAAFRTLQKLMKGAW